MSRVLILLSLLLTLPATAVAQGRTCQYDLECGTLEVCGEQGICVARGQMSGVSSDDQCGDDRRCRIDRLKRRNNARRHVKVIEEERQVKYQLQNAERSELEMKPRLKDPFAFGLRVSRIGPIGAFAGYSFWGKLQPSVEVTYSPDLYLYSPNTGFGGSLEAWWVRAGAAYFLLDGWFTPYLSAGFQAGFGNYFVWRDFGSSETQARFHAGEFGGGFDLQLKFGLNTRLGVVYRPLIYTQARVGPGQYDPTSRQGLADWYKSEAAVDVVWLLGWSI